MIQGKDKLILWFRSNNTPYWIIQKSESGPVIIKSEQKEGLELESSIRRLEESIDLMGPGTYHISAWSELKQATNTRFKTIFEHVAGSAAIGGMNGFNSGNIQELVQKEVQRQKDQTELETLRKEKQEWEAEKNSILWDIARQSKPYISSLLAGIFGVIQPGQVRPASQLSGTEQAGDLNQDEKRLATAFKKWADKDPEADQILIIEKIADLAEKNPATYQTAKQMLMNL